MHEHVLCCVFVRNCEISKLELLNIDNPYFEGMVNRIYPSKLQLNKANTSATEAPFLDLHLSISNGFVSSSATI